MSRITSPPLRTEALILCDDLRINGPQITLDGPFITTPQGKQRPYRLFALLAGEPGEYYLAVDALTDTGERFITRKAEAHRHVDRKLLSFFIADFTESSMPVGRVEYRLTCDGEIIGSMFLTAV